MDPKIVKSLSAKIYRQFPEMAGVQPKLRLQRTTQAKSVNSDPPSTYLLTFHTKVNISGGKSIPRWVRVVVNAKGTILKITTSRG